MNRRITRVIAGDAVDRMAAAKFNQKLDALHLEMAIHAEKLIKNYIPYPVRAIVEEYPSFFETTNYVSFSAINPKNQYGLKMNWLNCEQTISIPKSCKFITISYEDYQQFKEIADRYNKMQDKKQDFYNQCYKALIAIGQEKNLKEQFPAAIPYVVFPEVVQLPAVKYDELNKAVEAINNENHE